MVAKAEELNWLLGVLHEATPTPEHSEDVASVLWLTYRSGFPKLEPYPYCDDAGWGCMLRSAQMVMAHGLQRHWLGRQWRVPQELATRRRHFAYRRLLELFRDEPGLDSLFSIHNMCQVGMRYDKMPGEWYGPNTAALVLRDLAELLPEGSSFGGSFAGGGGGGSGGGGGGGGGGGFGGDLLSAAAGAASGARWRRLKVHVTQCDTIYVDQIEKLASGEPESDEEGDGAAAQSASLSPPKPGTNGRSSDPHVAAASAAASAAAAAAAASATAGGGAGAGGSADGGGSGRRNFASGKRGGKKRLRGRGKSPASPPAEARASGSGASSHQGSSSAEGGAAAAAAEIPFHDPLLNPPNGGAGAAEEWRCAVMILAPLRLGIDELHQGYAEGLLKTLQFPQSLGIIGGRPNHAIYFIGAQGTTLIGLDPHTTQPAAEAGEDWLSESYLRSMHCASPVTMAVSGVDPSLAVAFYCRDRTEFADLAARIKRMSSEPYLSPLSVEQASPDYNADLSLASAVLDTDGEEEEDDYVII